MIKLITKLEKSRIFWYILLISLLFFLLRLPSLIEPNWYGDEGIYQVMGRAINHGITLYSGIWDNKPPLLYLLYALFQGDQFSVRLASLFTGLFSVWTFFYLSQKLFEKTKISFITTTLFAVLFAIPYIEGNIANAENFMLLPILLAGLLIYKTKDEKPNAKILFSAGLLLGVAFLFKIVAIFDFVAFLVFFVIVNLPHHGSLLHLGREKFLKLTIDKLLIVSGFLLPFSISVIYFIFNNALTDYFRAAFFGMFGYVNYGNSLVIPQGLLLLKLSLLAILVLFLLLKRAKLSHAALFVMLWCGFSLFNALFSQRPYTHYVLVMLPSFCLLIGLILHEKAARTKQIFILFLIVIIASLLSTFKLNGFKKTIAYYQNAFLYVIGKKDVKSYQAFFDRKTPRDYDLASYVKMNLNPDDRLFVWGDSAQIYTLSQTLPINKYTVAYHITQSEDAIRQTQSDLDTLRPKYVIILPESRAFPFKLIGYESKFSLNDAVVYERSL
jgi:4-amino-4-deoxy-L-arabinose transferase-like glycosyltransferase